MDINTLRIAVTVVSLVLFLMLVVHSWSRRRTQAHQDAAMLPFLDEPIGPLPAQMSKAQEARP